MLNYDFKYFDNKVPMEIHEAVREYCLNQRWYSGYTNIPSIDIDPKTEDFKKDLTPTALEKGVYRVPFGWNEESMREHQPIATLFDYINDTLLDGRYEVTGRPEGSAGIGLEKNDLVRGWGEMPVNVAFNDGSLSKQQIIEHGATSYFAAQPYETVKRTKGLHRDNCGWSLEANWDDHHTLIFVANLKWKPEWHSEIVYYRDTYEDVNGMKFEDLTQNLDARISWPDTVMPNVPGRVIFHDSRTMHSTKPTGILAPELSQHVGFRVRLKEEFRGIHNAKEQDKN